MSLGMELGLGEGDFVLDGDHAPPSPKGGGAPLIFGPRKGHSTPPLLGPCL